MGHVLWELPPELDSVILQVDLDRDHRARIQGHGGTGGSSVSTGRPVLTGAGEQPVDRKTRGRRTLDVARLVLMVAAAVWVWKLASLNGEVEAALRVMGPLAERSSVQDRLVGTRLSLPTLDRQAPSVDGRSGDGELRLLWIVDLARCPACFGVGLAIWNALAEDRSLRRHVLVLGDLEVADDARRALRGTTITSVSREEMDLALGPLLPNTKILVDGSGTVLMADSRAAASECGWSFEAQVGALRGVLTSGVIRSQP